MLSIMAGNPKVDILKDGSIELTPQLEAFESALRVTTETRDRIGGVYLAFDHTGRFKDRFLRKDFLSRTDINVRRKRRLTLADCAPEITEIYRPIADRYSIPLESIGVITEEHARAAMISLHQKLEPPFDKVAGVMRQPLCEKQCNVGERADEEPDDKLKITCKGITAAIIERLARDSDTIHLFWEYDPIRCKPFTIIGGMMLAEKIFPLHGRRLINTMIFTGKDGSILPITTSHIIS